MLFVTWKDGHPPSQFTYPGTNGLTSILDGDPVLLTDGSELIIDPDLIRSAYLVEVPEGTAIHSIAPLT